jgi:hypothetical protein
VVGARSSARPAGHLAGRDRQQAERPVAAAVPVARARLMAPRPQVAAEVAGSAEHLSVHRHHPAFRAHPEHRVAAGNRSGADRPDLCPRAGHQPVVSAGRSMEPLPEAAVREEEVAAVVKPVAMVQSQPEVLAEGAAAAVESRVAPPAVAAGEAAAVMVDVPQVAAAAQAAQPGVAARVEAVVEEPVSQPEAAARVEEVVEEWAAQPAAEPGEAAAAEQAGVRRAVLRQEVVVARPADARREAVRHLEARPSAVASRPSSAVQAGPGPAGPGRRRTCRHCLPHRSALWFAPAATSSRSPSLPAAQGQFAS